MENVFESIDAIDAALDEQFGKDKIEENNNVVDAEDNSENNDVVEDAMAEEGVSKEEPETKEPEQVDNNNAQTNDEGNKSSK